MTNLIFLDSVKKMPLMALPVRSTYVPLKNAGILISPGSMLTAEQLKTLPKVTDIVGPSLLHLAGVPGAQKVFSDAVAWGAPGATDKKPGIKWSEEISESNWPFRDELPVLLLRGMPKINECVFIHQESKTLIVCDACFNITNPWGLGAWLILHMFGTYKRFGVSSFFEKFVHDRDEFEKSLGRLFAFDFENIVMGHGTLVNGNGRNLLLKALKERKFEPRS